MKNLESVVESDGRTTIYQYDGMGRVVHMNYPDGWQEDVEAMDGKVAAIRLSSGTADRTPRGLTVGDSAYRAWLLYGMCAFSNSFYYQVEDGFVSSIVFCTRYWGSNF